MDIFIDIVMDICIYVLNCALKLKSVNHETEQNLRDT